MIRVLMIAPLLIIVGLWIASQAKRAAVAGGGQVDKVKLVVPWFAVGFILVAAFNSLDWLPGNVVGVILELDKFLLTMAMTALGVETHVSKFKQAGIKPMVLALILFAWLIFGGLAIVHLVVNFL